MDKDFFEVFECKALLSLSSEEKVEEGCFFGKCKEYCANVKVLFPTWCSQPKKWQFYAVGNLKNSRIWEMGHFWPKKPFRREAKYRFCLPKKRCLLGRRTSSFFKKSCHTPSSSCEIEIIWRGEGRPRSKIGNSISRPVFYFFDRNMCEIACFSSPKIFSGSLRWPLNTAPKKRGGGGESASFRPPPQQKVKSRPHSLRLLCKSGYIFHFSSLRK